MTVKTKLSVAAVALLILLFTAAGWFAMQDADSTPAPVPDAGAEPEDAAPADVERRTRRTKETPVEAEPPDEVEPAETPEAPPDEPKVFVVRTNVPGARVRVEFQYYGGEPDPEPGEKVTGEDGSVRFLRAAHPMELASIVVVCDATGYGRVRKTTREDEIDLELQPALLLSGVVRSDSGAVLEEARIRTRRGPWADTDAEGQFSMFVTGEPQITLNVEHSGHRPQQVDALAGSGPIVIVLERGEQISGRVTWPGGKPAARISVGSRNPRATTTTDEDGRYVLSGLSPGTVEVDCQGVKENRTAEAGAAEVDFVLERHGVRVRIVDEQGRRFRQASMWVRATRDGGSVYTSAGSADSMGDRMVFFDAGTTVKFSPSAPGHLEEVTTVVLEGGAGLRDVEVVLRFGEPTGVIALRATNSAGTPLRTVFIEIDDSSGSPVETWYEREVALDADGRALLSNVPPGELTVTVSTTKSVWSTSGFGLRHEQTVTVVENAEAALTAVIRNGGRLRVTVRDSRGDVIAPDRLRLLREDGETIWGTFLTVRGPGAYTTALDDPVPVLYEYPLPEGRYRVVARPGTSQETTRDVTIVAGFIEEVELELPDAAE